MIKKRTTTVIELLSNFPIISVGFVNILSKSAIAIGVAGLFIETHEDPDNAPSDGPNMINISELNNILIKIIQFDNIAKNIN